MIVAINRWARKKTWRWALWWAVTAIPEIIGMGFWGMWQGAQNVWDNRPWEPNP